MQAPAPALGHTERVHRELGCPGACKGSWGVACPSQRLLRALPQRLLLLLQRLGGPEGALAAAAAGKRILGWYTAILTLSRPLLPHSEHTGCSFPSLPWVLCTWRANSAPWLFYSTKFVVIQGGMSGPVALLSLFRGKSPVCTVYRDQPIKICENLRHFNS